MFKTDEMDRLDVFKNFSFPFKSLKTILASAISSSDSVWLDSVAALERTLRCQTGKVARDLLSRQEFVAGEQAFTIFISYAHHRAGI